MRETVSDKDVETKHALADDLVSEVVSSSVNEAVV